MAYIDFTQVYSTLASVLLIASGLYTLLFDRRGYKSRSLVREAKWAKYIGVSWIASGCVLYVCTWTWQHFIW